MVRKTTKAVSTYVNLTDDEVRSIVMATSGFIKDKAVDPRKIVGAIHVKKYLADAKINGKVENWISIIKKVTAPVEDGKSAPELTSEEIETLEQCKAETKVYLESEASEALKKKVAESGDEYKNLKDISSSMKFKFSRYAYEAVTHVLNLMLREILVATCDNCAAQVKANKLTKFAHIPWSELQVKLMAGLYMNTRAVYDAVHLQPETEDTTADETTPVESEVEADTEASETAEEEEVNVNTTKPRLSQYIQNTFKEIKSQDERFKSLLLGKEISAIVNDIIFQVLDRYANVIKSLLQTANSKTVTERHALIATKILLQDHIHSSDEDVAVILDVVQARIAELAAIRKNKGKTDDDGEDELEEDDEQQVEESTPPTPVKKGGKKAVKKN